MRISCIMKFIPQTVFTFLVPCRVHLIWRIRRLRMQCCLCVMFLWLMSILWWTKSPCARYSDRKALNFEKKCLIILSLRGCNELNMAMMMSHAEWNSENLIVLFIIMPQFFFNIPSVLFFKIKSSSHIFYGDTRICMFVHPSWKFFTDMETSPLPVKCYKFKHVCPTLMAIEHWMLFCVCAPTVTLHPFLRYLLRTHDICTCCPIWQRNWHICL